MDVEEKVVLVTFGERRRDTKFRFSSNPEEEMAALLAAVEETFSDVLSDMSSHFVQLRSEQWQEYIDLQDKMVVPNRAVLHLRRKEDEVSKVSSSVIVSQVRDTESDPR